MFWTSGGFTDKLNQRKSQAGVDFYLHHTYISYIQAIHQFDKFL